MRSRALINFWTAFTIAVVAGKDEVHCGKARCPKSTQVTSDAYWAEQHLATRELAPVVALCCLPG